MKRKVAVMYTGVELKDGREGAIVMRQFDKKISPKVCYTVDIDSEDELIFISAFEEDFESVEEWEEVEEDEVTQY